LICLLLDSEGPSDPWQPLLNEKSLQDYARFLHKYTYALLTGSDPNASSYHLHLTDDMKALGNELLEALKREWSGDQAKDAGEEHEHEGDQHEEDGSGGGARGEEDMEEHENENENEHNRDREAEADKEEEKEEDEEDEEDEDTEKLIGDNEEDDEESEDDWVMSKDDESYDSDLVQVFHDFIRSALYLRARPDKMLHAPSKWDDPIERFIAVYSLQPDGNFRQAQQVTGVFAMFHYHIRGAIFYEGYSKIDNFGGNLYKYAFPTFLDLPVFLTHVYCIEQCFMKHCKTSSQATARLPVSLHHMSGLPAPCQLDCDECQCPSNHYCQQGWFGDHFPRTHAIYSYLESCARQAGCRCGSRA